MNQLISRAKSLFVMLAIMAATSTTQAQVQINTANFPDENFRNYLLSQSYGADGQLTDEEIQNITSLYLDNQNITNLEGIKNFTALINLSCNNNSLTQLDVSWCNALQTLSCNNNNLTQLNMNFCNALQTLSCKNNKLTTLSLILGGENLTTLFCEYNKLTSIDLTGCSKLKFLNCAYNQLTSLNLSLSGCDAIQSLYCQNNKLNWLNISGKRSLENLNCQFNRINQLIVSKCTALTQLHCSYNGITYIDISECSSLQSLSCEYNHIKKAQMDELVNSLPQTEYGGNFYAVLNGGDENEITQEQVDIARNKGWYVTYHLKNTPENSNSSNSNTNNNGTNTGSTTGLLNIENYNLKLYPNPTSNVLYVEEAGQEVLVYSSNGQIVLRQSATASGATRIDMGHLPTGTYLIRSGNAVAKVVKQ